jgi:hypothetical protein
MPMIKISSVGVSQTVQNAYLALEGEASKEGIKINEEKTKYLIKARNDRTIRDVEQSVAIGSLMTPTNDVSPEIQRKIQTANRTAQISSDCANICGRTTFHTRQNSPFTRP